MTLAKPRLYDEVGKDATVYVRVYSNKEFNDVIKYYCFYHNIDNMDHLLFRHDLDACSSRLIILKLSRFEVRIVGYIDSDTQTISTIEYDNYDWDISALYKDAEKSSYIDKVQITRNEVNAMKNVSSMSRDVRQ